MGKKDKKGKASAESVSEHRAKRRKKQGGTPDIEGYVMPRELAEDPTTVAMSSAHAAYQWVGEAEREITKRTQSTPDGEATRAAVFGAACAVAMSRVQDKLAHFGDDPEPEKKIDELWIDFCSGFAMGVHVYNDKQGELPADVEAPMLAELMFRTAAAGMGLLGFTGNTAPRMLAGVDVDARLDETTRALVRLSATVAELGLLRQASQINPSPFVTFEMSVQDRWEKALASLADALTAHANGIGVMYGLPSDDEGDTCGEP